MDNSIASSWNRIVGWLNSNAPEALEQMQGPASEQQLDAAAIQMGQQLPADFREFYRLVNGADSSGIFPSYEEWDMAFSPMPLELVVRAWESHKTLLESGDFDREPKSENGIANVWWNVAWIPFADNGAGDCYCIDLAPTNTGVKGQIITHSHETGKHLLLARSLTEYLHNLADALDSGMLEYEVVYGLLKIENEE